MTSAVPGPGVSYIRSNPVSPPSKLQLDRRTRCALNVATRQLGMLRPAIAQAATQLLSENHARFRRKTVVRDLAHELSAYVPDIMVPGSADDAATVLGKEAREREAFASLRQAFFDALHAPGPDPFLDCLAAIASSATGDAQAYRQGPIGTTPDRFGRRWLFPASPLVRPALLALRGYLARGAAEDTLARAVVAHVIIGAMHPFADGNGRTARVVFNLVAGQLNEFASYIPLRQIFQMSHFGYEIRMRHTVASGDWIDLIRYFCNVIRTFHCAATSSLRAIPSPRLSDQP